MHGFLDGAASFQHQTDGIPTQGVARHLLTSQPHEDTRIALVGGHDQGIGHFEVFINPLPSGIPALVAMGTAIALAINMRIHLVAQLCPQPFAFLRIGLVFIDAARTDDAHQTLRQHQLQRHRHHEGRYPHVDQAHRRRQGIVGMQGRQHQVAGHSTAQADFGRHPVTHFADQNDVRILTHGRTQHALEGQVDLVQDLYLIEPGQSIFDWIFNRDDFLLG